MQSVELFEEHVGFAHGIANKHCAYVPKRADMGAIRNSALIGLWKAAESFDAAKGVPFKGYAFRWIEGAVRTEMRDQQGYTRIGKTKPGQDQVEARPRSHTGTVPLDIFDEKLHPAEVEDPRLDPPTIDADLLEAIWDLPYREREVILDLIRDRSTERTARRLKTTVGTVRATRLVARKKLRAWRVLET